MSCEGAVEGFVECEQSRGVRSRTTRALRTSDEKAGKEDRKGPGDGGSRGVRGEGRLRC